MDKFDTNSVYVEQTGMVFVKQDKILISFSCDITQKDSFMNAAVTTSYFEGISRIYYTTLMCPIGFESSATLIESGNNLLQFCNFLSRYRFEPYTEMHLFLIFGHHIFIHFLFLSFECKSSKHHTWAATVETVL